MPSPLLCHVDGGVSVAAQPPPHTQNSHFRSKFINLIFTLLKLVLNWSLIADGCPEVSFIRFICTQ